MNFIHLRMVQFRCSGHEASSPSELLDPSCAISSKPLGKWNTNLIDKYVFTSFWLWTFFVNIEKSLHLQMYKIHIYETFRLFYAIVVAKAFYSSLLPTRDSNVCLYYVL